MNLNSILPILKRLGIGLYRLKTDRRFSLILEGVKLILKRKKDMGFLTSFLKQKVVYWEVLSVDGYNHTTFSDPLEISCRWTNNQVIFLDSKGKECRSIAVVNTDWIIYPDGFIYLGNLKGLSTAQKADPTLLDTAYPIKKVQSTLSVDGQEVHYRVFL